MSVDPESVRQLGDELVRMQRGFAAMRQRLTGPLHPVGAGPDGVEWAAYGLLHQLVQDGPCRSSALAGAACVDPSTVSRQVAQLVAAGLAERRSDPDDGRAALLEATAAGKAAYAAKQEHRAALFTRVLQDWSSADVVTLTRLIARFNDSVADHRDSLPQLEEHQS